MAPLCVADIRLLSECDAIIVNFITGCEVELEALTYLSKNAAGLLYLDYHSLGWGIDGSGRRYPRKRVDWQKWTEVANIVQMNEIEAATLLEFRLLPLPDDWTTIAEFFLRKKTNACIITLGENGALVCSNNGQEAWVEHLPALHVDAVDPTGCGDAFAAGFITRYCKSGDLIASARFANYIAGVNCTFSGTESADKLAGRIAGYFRKNENAGYSER